MIEIIVNGTPYTDFTSATVNISLETLSNDFSFTASAVNGFPPLFEDDEVQILIDSEIVLTGYIEEVNGIEAEGTHSVTYSGRDKTGDFVDSTINIIPELKASESLTLKSIIETVIAHIGASISVIDELNPDPFNKAEDIIVPKVGQNCLDFVSSYAQKRQALLSSNADGNILITQSKSTDTDVILESIKGSTNNNILSQNWSIERSSRFNKYVSRGQIDPIALNFGGDSGVDSVQDQGGTFIDSDIRGGRQFVKVEKKSYSNEQLESRAKWSSQLARARAIKYSCTVKGHSDVNGNTWDINKLCTISSQAADVSRKMLINNVTFTQAEQSPSITTLGFVERDVYTINEKILSQRPTGNLFDAFGPLG